MPFLYHAKWYRDRLPLQIAQESAQYQKAYAASFPSHLWPAVEEETEDGSIFLILRDGTRILAEEAPSYRKSRGNKSEAQKAEGVTFTRPEVLETQNAEESDMYLESSLVKRLEEEIRNRKKSGDDL